MASTLVDLDPAPRQYRQLIAGKWVEAESGQTFEDFNPYTGEVFARIPAATAADARRAIETAHKAFPAWAATSARERQRLFLRAADVIDRRANELVTLLAVETGAVPAFARFQIQWATGLLRQAAGYPYLSGGEIVPSDTPGVFALAIRKPLGVVAGMSPWNGAFNLAWRTITAPLACGNTLELKPSEEAPVSAGLILADILLETGFPPNVLSVITHAPGEVGPIADQIFESREVRAINFTGSTATGRLLAERAGRHLKRIALELGGYNPMIVLQDADLDYAVSTAVFSAFFHQGQICMNTRKFLVERPIFQDFLEQFAAKTKALRPGNPTDACTKIGPLINDKAVDKAKRSIAEAVAKGARIVAGGENKGRCFEPTVLVDVPSDVPLYCEEVFAPVAVVEPVDSPEEAVRKANFGHYGLTASIFTRDTGKAIALADQIQAGMVNVNGPTMAGEPQIPFGGVKDSGWARFGRWAIDTFTDLNLVTVSMQNRQFPI